MNPDILAGKKDENGKIEATVPLCEHLDFLRDINSTMELYRDKLLEQANSHANEIKAANAKLMA